MRTHTQPYQFFYCDLFKKIHKVDFSLISSIRDVLDRYEPELHLPANFSVYLQSQM